MSESTPPETPTPDPLLHPEQVAPKQSRVWLRWGGYGIGLGLLIACIVVAVRYTDFSPLKQADPTHVVLLCLLILTSLSCNAVLFQLSLRSFKGGDRVSTTEWQTLMAASALLNYLPKAGMLGRVAYLKARHGIGLRSNVWSLIHVGAGTTGVYVLLVLLTLWRREFDVVWVVLACAGVGAGAIISVPLIRATGRDLLRPLSTGSMMFGSAMWYAIRVIDAFAFAGRVYLAAMIFQIPLDLPGAMAVGMVCNFAVMVAPVPGGAGVREWLGALLLSSGLAGQVGLSQAIGLLLVDRAAEVFVFLAVGVPALIYLHRQRPRDTEISTNSDDQVSTPSIK